MIRLIIAGVMVTIMTAMNAFAAGTTPAGSNSMGWSAIHITVIFSIISICLTLITVLPKALEKNKSIAPEDKPGEPNFYCKQQKDSMKKIEDKITDGEKEMKAANGIITEMKIAIASIEKDVRNTNKTVEDMINDNKNLANRLDSLLGQLLSFIGDS